MVSGVRGHHAQLLHGVLDMCLLALIAHEPNYGYALASRLEEHGIAAGSESSIYPILRRLDRHELIAADLEPSDSGPARKVYHLTHQGRALLRAWVEDWQEVTDGVQGLLRATGAVGPRPVDPVEEHHGHDTAEAS